MFKLPFQPPPIPEKLSLDQQVLMLGSCFSASIGDKLQRYKWHTATNPFGTIYNPLSLFHLLDLAASDLPPETELFQSNDVWYSWSAHSLLSAMTEEGLRAKIHKAKEQIAAGLNGNCWIVITPGTAWVYERKDSEKLVANCHRQPADQFSKRLLNASEITEAFHRTQQRLPPQVKWLFTISPVRHIRDGLIENNRSKAVLIDAVHELVRTHDHCYYFPSYEIVIDELRDHRFFAEDLAHPNSLAIDYVWKQLCQSWLSDDAQRFVTDWRPILKALAHRPQHPETAAHQKFLHATILRLKRLEKKVDITNELQQLQAQLNG